MKRIYWHRLFGLMLMDYLSNRGFRVELEKDLSLKRQMLDVVIVERCNGEPDIAGICDGFDNLSRHNLLSYKSRRQTLNVWAIEELIGHYVNYCKVLGRDSRRKADDIRLYAVSTRRPDTVLALPGVTKVKPGVYDLRVLSREIRILVLRETPTEQRNAILSLFSFDPEKVKFAMDHYHWQQEDGSTVINQLLEQYALEGVAMPYTMEQFRKDYIKAHLGEMDPDEVLSMFDPEARLKGLDPKDVLSRYDPEARLKGLDPKDVLSRYDPETRLKGLDPEKIEAYLKKLKKRKMN